MLEVETEGRDRFAIWANSLAIFADHPMLGAGKGNFRFIYPVYARRAIEDRSFSPQARAADAHNDYIQLLAETGVLGTASFLLILVLLALRFWRGLRQKPNPKLFVIGFALVAVLAEAFWDFPLNLPVPVAFFWIYAGMLWQLTQTHAPKEHQPLRALSSLTIVLATLLATLFAILTLSYVRGEFYYSRGARESYQGRLKEAEKDLTKATEINPLNYRYHFLLGLLLIKMKDYEKAADSIRHSLSLDPYNINALNNLGVAYASAGDTSKAVQAFQTALRIWPRYIEPHKSLGFIYAREGEREKAIRYFQAVLALDASDRQARDSLLALGVIPLGQQR
jgi:tetratricopeptide (TPR) repeat protein